jgi:hypothetical protein
MECKVIQRLHISWELQAPVFATKITGVFKGVRVDSGVGGGIVVGWEKRMGNAVTVGFPLVDEGGG